MINVQSCVQVEDFTDQSQNVSRAVGAAEMKLIYKCIQHSICNVFSFIGGYIEGSKLQELLFGRVAKLPLVGVNSAHFNTNAAWPCSFPQSIHANNFGEKAVVSTVVAEDARVYPNAAQPCISPSFFTQTRITDGLEETQKALVSNCSLTQRLIPVDARDGWHSLHCQQIERAVPLNPDMAKKLQCTGDWTAITTDTWDRRTSANLALRQQFPILENAMQPVNNCRSADMHDWEGNQLSIGGDWNGPQQLVASGSFLLKERETSNAFGTIQESRIFSNTNLPVVANPYCAPPCDSAALRFHSDNTNDHAPPPHQTLLSKRKRKRFNKSNRKPGFQS